MGRQLVMMGASGLRVIGWATAAIALLYCICDFNELILKKVLFYLALGTLKTAIYLNFNMNMACQRHLLSAVVLGLALPLFPVHIPVPEFVLSSPSAQAQRAPEFRLMNEGKGGYTGWNGGAYYHYQVWVNASNTQFLLRIWNDADFPQGEPAATHMFASGRDALDYFDCYYARKSLSICPK